MSNEHPDMHGNPMDAPFLCHQCEKEVREDRAYGSDAAPSEMFCSLECVNEWQESQISTLTAERDEARKELAVLKAAPGMDEVDALGKSATQTLAQIVLDRPETNRPAIDTVPAGRYAKLRDLIDAMLATCRRSIAAREEVVGLLKHILSCIITVKQENTPEWMEYIAEEVNRINEAMGDLDRVSLRLGGIVIVKGGPEIAEGKNA